MEAALAITKPVVDIKTIINSYEKEEKIPFEENKHKFKKIAFDVYAPLNDATDNLWVVQDTDDGSFLTRTHWDHDNVNVKESKEEGWDALPDKSGDNITLYYKDTPLINMSAKEYGFDQGDPRIFINSLLGFMRDKKNVAALLRDLPQNKVAMLKKANVLTNDSGFEANVDDYSMEADYEQDPYDPDVSSDINLNKEENKRKFKEMLSFVKEKFKYMKLPEFLWFTNEYGYSYFEDRALRVFEDMQNRNATFFDFFEELADLFLNGSGKYDIPQGIKRGADGKTDIGNDLSLVIYNLINEFMDLPQNKEKDEANVDDSEFEANAEDDVGDEDIFQKVREKAMKSGKVDEADLGTVLQSIKFNGQVSSEEEIIEEAKRVKSELGAAYKEKYLGQPGGYQEEIKRIYDMYDSFLKAVERNEDNINIDVDGFLNKADDQLETEKLIESSDSSIGEFISHKIGLFDYFRQMENELSKGNKVFEKRLDITKKAYNSVVNKLKATFGSDDNFIDQVSNISLNKLENLRAGLYRYIIQYPKNVDVQERFDYRTGTKLPMIKNVVNKVDLDNLIKNVFGVEAASVLPAHLKAANKILTKSEEIMLKNYEDSKK